MPELDGPRLEPKSGTAKQLVVFVHGYGADGNDLIEIGRAWQGMLPETAFVSPHAPEPCGQAPMGRQWFNLTFRTPNERWDGVSKAGPGLDKFLDAELARRKLPPSALALVGFSQGTMMALHAGLRRNEIVLRAVDEQNRGPRFDLAQDRVGLGLVRQHEDAGIADDGGWRHGAAQS